MDKELVDFYYRSWCFLRSGTLEDSSLILVSWAAAPFPEFCLQLQGSELDTRLQDEKLAGEFLIGASYNRFDILDLIVTNRRIIYFESTGSLHERKDYERKSFGFNRVESCDYVQLSAFRTAVVLTFKDGSSSELQLSGGDKLSPMIKLAGEIGGNDWSHLWQDAGDYQAELRDYLESDKGKAAQAAAESERQGATTAGAILGPIAGVSAALLFMLFKGAPVAEGGPAMVQWMSQGGNWIIVVGAVALGWAAPQFMKW